MAMIFIPSYKVEAKTLGQLKNELAELERKYEENDNSKKHNLLYSTHSHSQWL